MKASLIASGAVALLASGTGVSAQAFSIDSDDAIKQTARTLAFDLMTYYTGNQSGQTPGILPGPPPAGDYYWWEGGAMWGAMMDYWQYTGDTSYNDVITQALLFQKGDADDYQPGNVTLSLGNDDQGFWGMSAMLAAEIKFPNPPEDQPGWLALAQAVFNTQAAPDRHDDTCGGGLRWQIPVTNKGYNYKNSIANGCFFNLGARLARYTGNTTYADWAEKTWQWMNDVGFMTSDYNIYDGGHVEHDCKDLNKAQFSYNAAVFLQGAAHMFNYTNGNETWKGRVEGLLDRTLDLFFPNGIAYEIACESRMSCTTDMLSFKGYLHRWLAQVGQVAPFTASKIEDVLKTSTQAAIAQCTGGTNGRTCGFQWSSGTFDGVTGAGETMNVLSAVSARLVKNVEGPVTNSTGGTSKGNPNAGSDSHDYSLEYPPPTTADKAGAGILTFLVLAGCISTFTWMSIGDS